MTDLTMDKIVKRYPVGTVLKLTATIERIDERPAERVARVVLLGGGGDAWITPAALAAAEIVSRPIRAGDKVRWPDGGGEYAVTAINGNKAWIGDGLDDHIANLSDLELAE